MRGFQHLEILWDYYLCKYEPTLLLYPTTPPLPFFDYFTQNTHQNYVNIKVFWMIIEKIINEKQKNPKLLRSFWKYMSKFSLNFGIKKKIRIIAISRGIEFRSETLELLLESSKIDKINVNDRLRPAPEWWWRRLLSSVYGSINLPNKRVATCSCSKKKFPQYTSLLGTLQAPCTMCFGKFFKKIEIQKVDKTPVFITFAMLLMW